jgi:hypothetical protein
MRRQNRNTFVRLHICFLVFGKKFLVNVFLRYPATNFLPVTNFLTSKSRTNLKIVSGLPPSFDLWFIFFAHIFRSLFTLLYYEHFPYFVWTTLVTRNIFHLLLCLLLLTFKRYKILALNMCVCLLLVIISEEILWFPGNVYRSPRMIVFNCRPQHQ